MQRFGPTGATEQAGLRSQTNILLNGHNNYRLLVFSHIAFSPKIGLLTWIETECHFVASTIPYSFIMQ